MKTYHYETNDSTHHIVCCNFRDSAKTINLIGHNVKTLSNDEGRNTFDVMVVPPLFCFLSTDKLINECAMKRTRTLFDFNFGKGGDRGMIKTKI